ncbi:MAG: Re/Si-specific NAD(P)(+) transhydrogenase subunit alpha [Armatimonadetes bacterium]|nr:Re/Si-specific NAD(P)(+) transhydrogenase subunit alpha [Armatimonadota bacterium]
MTVGITKERLDGENRVAATPETVKTFVAKGFTVVVESGAGVASGVDDHAYEEAGAKIAKDAAAVASQAEMILRVAPPSAAEVESFKTGTVVVSFLFPGSNLPVVDKLAQKGVTTFAVELIPRITRAQSMDALSAMSTIAGYKGALLAANSLPKFFPMFMTAAGTIPPAKVFVLGAGVAGLQAIATCKRLGAIVEAFDVRPSVKEQVESLGARFVALQVDTSELEDASGYAKEVSKDTHEKELELITQRMTKNDVVITTALIPGRPAPVLITREMVKHMARGSVIIDLAAPNGGNCEATVAGKSVEVDGVTVIGPTTLLSEMAADASKMYSKNIAEFVLNLAPEGAVKLDMEDQIIRDTLVTHEGKVTHEPTRLAMEKGAKS